MKLVKSSVALAMLAALSLPAVADVTVYGKANVTVQSSDEGEGSFTEVKSNASRFGVKGSEKVSDSLKVVYKMEWQVDMTDESKGSEDHIKSRNQYVGLKGGFGEVLVGRNDTALKQSQGKIDLFNDLEADIKHVFKGENRLGDSITYKTPKFSGMQLVASYIAEDEKDGDDGLSAALMYGDKKLKKSNVFASVAMDSEVKGMDIVRATVQGKVADFKLGAMYQTQEASEGKGGNDGDGYFLNAAYKINAYTLKAQYQVMDFDYQEEKTALSVGVDYKLNKKAKLFAFYTAQDQDAVANVEDSSEIDNSYLAVGMEYKF